LRVKRADPVRELTVNTEMPVTSTSRIPSPPQRTASTSGPLLEANERMAAAGGFPEAGL
jgi:hypothetical protein